MPTNKRQNAYERKNGKLIDLMSDEVWPAYNRCTLPHVSISVTT